MHVFIDTNILLNFFHFSKDELDALNSVFASHEHGSAKVHLTEQVCNEFSRNRDSKIKDALKRFHETTRPHQLPSFMKGYEEYDEILKLADEVQKKIKAISAKTDQDVAGRKLVADRLIGDIFGNSDKLPVDEAVFHRANMRVALGNPPGKKGSLGDAVNWILLLDSVPASEDIHVISEDGDFYSALNEDAPHTYLVDEWKEQKSGKLFVYRTLSKFMNEHFDGVAFSFDKNKELLIGELVESGNFARTHQLIAQLEEYSYFSAKDVQAILAAAVENDQFGWIVNDRDISDFLHRVAVPHKASIRSEEQREILNRVIEDRKLDETESP